LFIFVIFFFFFFRFLTCISLPVCFLLTQVASSLLRFLGGKGGGGRDLGRGQLGVTTTTLRPEERLTKIRDWASAEFLKTLK